uniref:WD repeat-containing protein 89 n=1 Tax=Diabrotica virgifera virgifera TaxID=50390 RepID=A0A6P7H0H6_DIAVI
MNNGKDINHHNLCDSELFVECNCLSEVQVTTDYIFNIDATKDNNPNIAVTTANKSCLVYSLDNNQLANIWESKKDKSKLIGCKYSSREKEVLYIGNSDGVIKTIDLRTPDKVAVQFKDTTAEVNKEKTFNCFDVSSNDRLLAAGTDVLGGDAFVLFWDIRINKLLGGYWQSHTDDITQSQHDDDFYLAKFHQLKNSQFILGGSQYETKEYLRALSLQKKGLEPYVEFKNNQQKVRDSAFNENTNILVTGGEQGVLNIWKITDPST